MARSATVRNMYSKQLLDYLHQELAGSAEPLFVGLDGRSGAGKSTLAAAMRAEFGADTVSVIEGDQFYAGGSGNSWDVRSVEDKVANAMDWARQAAVLGSLRTTGKAAWHSFDWEAADWDSDDARLADETIEARSSPIVLLEGAYSCRPELHSRLDALVLLDPPRKVRRAQLLSREGDAYRAEWEDRWSEAEDHYFDHIMPADSST